MRGIAPQALSADKVDRARITVKRNDFGVARRAGWKEQIKPERLAKMPFEAYDPTIRPARPIADNAFDEGLLVFILAEGGFGIGDKPVDDEPKRSDVERENARQELWIGHGPSAPPFLAAGNRDELSGKVKKRLKVAGDDRVEVYEKRSS